MTCEHHRILYITPKRTCLEKSLCVGSPLGLMIHLKDSQDPEVAVFHTYYLLQIKDTERNQQREKARGENSAGLQA